MPQWNELIAGRLHYSRYLYRLCSINYARLLINLSCNYSSLILSNTCIYWFKNYEYQEIHDLKECHGKCVSMFHFGGLASKLHLGYYNVLSTFVRNCLIAAWLNIIQTYQILNTNTSFYNTVILKWYSIKPLWLHCIVLKKQTFSEFIIVVTIYLYKIERAYNIKFNYLFITLSFEC